MQVACSLVLGQLQEVVVGDGRLPSACGANEKSGHLMGQEQMQEVFLASCLCCLNDQVTQLEGNNSNDNPLTYNKIGEFCLFVTVHTQA